MVVNNMPSRLRYTHKIRIRQFTDQIYNGSIELVMTPSVAQPSQEFMLCVEATGKGTFVVVGSRGGGSITETIELDGAGTIFGSKLYDQITSISCSRFNTARTCVIRAVDELYQPVRWFVLSSPYNAVVSTLGGLGTAVQAQSLGLKTTIVRYIRCEWRTPVTKGMEFTITPGYDDVVFVPITDFNNVTLPGVPLAQSEWEFNAVEKAQEA